MTQEGSFTAVDGCTIAFAVQGNASGAPLLLSNSLGATHAMWRRQLPALRDRHMIITYDTRGHGRSDAPAGAYSLDRLARDALELLDHLDIQRVHFCGVSLGGMTGQWLAAHAPERIDRLVLAHTSAHMPPAQGWQDRIRTVLDQSVAAIAPAVAERWVTEAFKTHRPADFDELIRSIAAIDSTGYAGCCAAIRDMDLRPLTSAISATTLVIAGRADLATPVSHAKNLAQGIVGARLVTTPGAHVSNIEFADEFNNFLISHLGRA